MKVISCPTDNRFLRLIPPLYSKQNAGSQRQIFSSKIGPFKVIFRLRRVLKLFDFHLKFRLVLVYCMKKTWQNTEYTWYFDTAWHFEASCYSSTKPLESQELLTQITDSTQQIIWGAFLPDFPENWTSHWIRVRISEWLRVDVNVFIKCLPKLKRCQNYCQNTKLKHAFFCCFFPRASHNILHQIVKD